MSSLIYRFNLTLFFILMMDFQWNLKKFDELNNKELYRILKLRMEVFVLEQECLYPELDDKDFSCLHLWAEHNDDIIAYTRLVPPLLLSAGFHRSGHCC